MKARLSGLAGARTTCIAGGLALAASVALFFWSRSPMWLDEAQTVWIAHRPIGDLPAALKMDGAPPLFYFLLHGWMAVFGTSSEAVRALPGVFAVLTLPAVALLARRMPMLEAKVWAPVLLVATCPFVIRYATEARMYSLVLFLTVVAALLFERVWNNGGVGWTIGAGLSAGLLLLTQYWTLYLLVVVGVAALVAAIRGSRPARRVIVALVIGAAVFSPWLPSFAYQRAHTGAPWGSPPPLNVAVLALGSWTGSGVSAPWLKLSYYLLVAVAVAGHVARSGGLRIGKPVRRLPLMLGILSVATLLLGAIASELGSEAYAPRYSMVVLPFMLLVVAMGVAALPAHRRNAAIAALCAFGLIVGVQTPFQSRTQAGEVAKALENHATPADLIVFCPDQLGPAVNRLVPTTGTQVVYPTMGTPAVVDWVDYKQRNENANPDRFSDLVLSRAAGHPIWLVWEDGYPTLLGACQRIYTDLTAARGRPAVYVQSSKSIFESEELDKFNPS
ncbi:MAG TPA: glycosyltransferase family 39 protein [Mycobacteriales bacterium]|nr:glycosyltransferase family 39 protein [Mycobacteriales bacterium]